MDRDVLAAALARFSAASVFHVQQLQQGEAACQRQPSGAFKRAAKAALGPFHGCFKPLSVPSAEDAAVPVVFYAADMKELLRLVMQRCPSVADMIRRNAGMPLRAIVAHDECTAGNVLNPLQRQKTLLFYCGFTLMDPILESARGWYPIAAVTHEQIQAAAGGVSAITAAFFRHWAQADLTTPFHIEANLVISIKLEMFLSDLESQRASLAAKGSAGLRPCIFCSNCVMKNAVAAERDPNFLTVLEHDFNLFSKFDKADLENLMIHWLSCAPNMSKKEKELRERCLGFRLDPSTIWSDPIARSLFHIDMICNDSMHCYFSNGICNAEICLLLERAEKKVQITADNLCRQMQAEGWHRRGSENAHWCRRLWGSPLFGEVYKGSAAQTVALFLLLQWFALQWLHMPEMEEYCKCFLQLGRCVELLRLARHGRHHWDQLDAAQRKHQQMFASLYPSHTRPKHHHRLHLPEMYHRHGFAVGCWGVEAAHQNYKGTFADVLRQFLQSGANAEVYSKNLLPRLLLRAIQAMNDRPFLPAGYRLLRPFEEDEVHRMTGLQNVQIAQKCQLQLQEVAEGDLLLWSEDKSKGGKIHFFLCKQEKLYVYVSILQACGLESKNCYRKFKQTDEKLILTWDPTCHVPAWSCIQNDIILCLP